MHNFSRRSEQSRRMPALLDLPLPASGPSMAITTCAPLQGSRRSRQPAQCASRGPEIGDEPRLGFEDYSKDRSICCPGECSSLRSSMFTPIWPISVSSRASLPACRRPSRDDLVGSADPGRVCAGMRATPALPPASSSARRAVRQQAARVRQGCRWRDRDRRGTPAGPVTAGAVAPGGPPTARRRSGRSGWCREALPGEGEGADSLPPLRRRASREAITCGTCETGATLESCCSAVSDPREPHRDRGTKSSITPTCAASIRCG
jgi:hypothetical protein